VPAARQPSDHPQIGFLDEACVWGGASSNDRPLKVCEATRTLYSPYPRRIPTVDNFPDVPGGLLA